MKQPTTSNPATPSGAGALRFDIVAGLTAAAVVLPKAMAYATVAGLPVAVGLYTAFIPMAIYALLGSSRVLSVSSTTTLAILAGTELGLVVPDGAPSKLVIATATLTALVGAMLLLARPLPLGFDANLISTPTRTGSRSWASRKRSRRPALSCGQPILRPMLPASWRRAAPPTWEARCSAPCGMGAARRSPPWCGRRAGSRRRLRW